MPLLLEPFLKHGQWKPQDVIKCFGGIISKTRLLTYLHVMI